MREVVHWIRNVYFSFLSEERVLLLFRMIFWGTRTESDVNITGEILIFGVSIIYIFYKTQSDQKLYTKVLVDHLV